MVLWPLLGKYPTGSDIFSLNNPAEKIPKIKFKQTQSVLDIEKNILNGISYGGYLML